MLNRFTKLFRFAALGAKCACLVFFVAALPSAYASVPQVIASSQSLFATQGTSITKVVGDSFGNIFAVDGQNGELYEIPAGTSTVKVLIASGLGGSHGLAVDSYGDVMVSAGYGGSAVYFLPNISGTICTTCGPNGKMLNLVSANGMNSTALYFYAQLADIAIDNKTGYVYVASSSTCNYCTGPTMWVIKTQGPTTSAATLAIAGAAKVYLSSLPGGKSAVNMAMDNAENLYYADGSFVYTLNVTTTPTPTPVTFGSVFTTPNGVTTDSFGNLYVSDSGTKLLYVIPNEGGALNPADQYALAAPSSINYGVGIDPSGNIYNGGAYVSGNSPIYKTTLGYGSFASSAVGTVATPNTTLTFVFNAATTFSSINFLQGPGAATEFKTAGGTCTALTAYAIGKTCTVTAAFTPSSTGSRRGAVVLLSAAGKPVATAQLAGIGTGAALTLDPGTQTALTGKSAWSKPGAIALDSLGNTYVADTAGNTVQVISSTGTAVASIGTNLSGPTGVAVDGAGNVYISDAGHNRIVEVPNEAGTLNSADQVVLPTVSPIALNQPLGLAVDPYGALYVADSGNARVVRYLTFNGAAAALASVYSGTITTGGVTTSTLQLPSSVASDASGNLYIADESAQSIAEIVRATGVQSTVLTQLTAPLSVAVDASNSVYVVDNNNVLRYPNIGGTLIASAQLSLGTGLVTPTGVAVNGAGNVAISDSGIPNAFVLTRTAGLLNFGPLNATLNSVAQTLTLTSAGTASATLSPVPYVATGSTANFSVAPTSNNGCAASQTLALGTTCGFSGTFSPTTTGPLSETLTFASNAVNASLVATLTGTGTNLGFTTTTLAQVLPAPPASPYYGQSVTVSATVVALKAGLTPTGSVQFYLDGVANGKPVALTTASPYTATQILPGVVLNVGAHSVTASYSGDTLNSSSNTGSAGALILTVTKQATSITATISPTVAQVTGSNSLFVAIITPIANGTPSGTVSLVPVGSSTGVATGILGNAPPLPFVCPKGSICSMINYASAATTQFQVFYLGDNNYSGSISNTLTALIRGQGFDVLPTVPVLTIAQGGSGSEPITVAAVSGYTGNIAIGALDPSANKIAGCTGLPAYTTCTFSFSASNNALTAGNYPISDSTLPYGLVIATNVPPATQYVIPGGFGLWTGLLAGMMALTFAMRKRRGGSGYAKLAVLLLCVSSAAVALGISGCSSGTSNAYLTPKGTYTITLTFTGTPLAGTNAPSTGNIISTATFQLIVQ